MQKFNSSASVVVVLVVMVRNEQKALPRLLSSAQQIATHVVICDTGSTDRTEEFARLSWGKDQTFLFFRASPFVNFEVNRNECIEMAQVFAQKWKPDWYVLADADWESRVAAQTHLPAAEGAQVNLIQIHPTGGGIYYNSRNSLISASALSRCRYRLPTHEFLECSNVTFGIHSGFYFLDHQDGANRPERTERDIRLLRSFLNQTKEKDLLPRAYYYLARSYEDAANITLAKRWYERHLRVEQFTNYRFMTRYRMALLVLQDANATVAQKAESLLSALDEQDGYFRREIYYYLARLYRVANLFNRCIAYGTAGMHSPHVDHSRIPLFLEQPIFDWALEEELAFCLLQRKEKARAKKHLENILERVPLSVKPRVLDYIKESEK